MHVEPGVFLEPRLHDGMLMRGVVVTDHMHVEVDWNVLVDPL